MLTKEIIEDAFKRMLKPVKPRPLARLQGYWGKMATTSKSCPLKKVCFKITDTKRHRYQTCIFYRQSSMPKGKTGTGPVTVLCSAPTTRKEGKK